MRLRQGDTVLVELTVSSVSPDDSGWTPNEVDRYGTLPLENIKSVIRVNYQKGDRVRSNVSGTTGHVLHAVGDHVWIQPNDGSMPFTVETSEIALDETE